MYTGGLGSSFPQTCIQNLNPGTDAGVVCQVLRDGTVHVLTVDGIIPADVRSGDVDVTPRPDVSANDLMLDQGNINHTSLSERTPI